MRQRYLYDEFINHDVKRSSNNDFLNLMNLLMKLRKTCNHPDLIEKRKVESPIYLERIQYTVPGECFFLGGQLNLSTKNSPTIFTNFLDFGSNETQLAQVRRKELMSKKKGLQLIIKDYTSYFQSSMNEFNREILNHRMEEKLNLLRSSFEYSKLKLKSKQLAWCRNLTLLINVFSPENYDSDDLSEYSDNFHYKYGNDPSGDRSIAKLDISSWYYSYIHKKTSNVRFPSFQRRFETFFQDYDDFMFLYKKVVSGGPEFFVAPTNSCYQNELEYLEFNQ